MDIYSALSTNEGNHWTRPTLVDVSGTGEENSYPSVAGVDDTHAAIIWLDGSNWEKKRVALMSRTVRADGTMTEATVLDEDTCTCCPTSLVSTGNELVAAYRGHTGSVWLPWLKSATSPANNASSVRSRRTMPLLESRKLGY